MTSSSIDDKAHLRWREALPGRTAAQARRVSQERAASINAIDAAPPKRILSLHELAMDPVRARIGTSGFAVECATAAPNWLKAL